LLFPQIDCDFRNTWDRLFHYLRSNQFPEPGEYQDDVDDYLGSVMGNEKVSVDVRLKSSR
jgi:hypothetical protein